MTDETVPVIPKASTILNRRIFKDSTITAGYYRNRQTAARLQWTANSWNNYGSQWQRLTAMADDLSGHDNGYGDGGELG